MATIVISIKDPTQSGDAPLPNVGDPSITFHPLRVSKSGYLRTDKPFTVWLNNGAASVELDTTPAGRAYMAVENFPGQKPRSWYFTVAGSTRYEQLVAIDPATLSPVEADAAWAVQLEQLRQLVEAGGGGGGGPIGGATETEAGVVEFATAAETATGADSTRAVHPAGLAGAVPAKARSACYLKQSSGSYPAAPGGYATYVYLGVVDPASLGITLNPYDQWIGPS